MKRDAASDLGGVGVNGEGGVGVNGGGGVAGPETARLAAIAAAS